MEIQNEYLEKLLSAADTPDDNIHLVIELVRPPFYPVCDDRGYLYDDATIAVRCSSGHIHKYPINKIRSDFGINSCITCGKETRFAKTVRVTIEKILRVPFAKSNIITGCDFEYANPVAGLVITGHVKPGEHNCTVTNNWTVITLYKPAGKNMNSRDVQLVIHNYLKDYPKLSQEQMTSVTNICPKNTILLSRSTFVRDPLPYSREYAAYTGVANVVESADMCLENC